MALKRTYISLLLSFLWSCQTVQTNRISEESKLVADLLKNRSAYGTIGRPVYNASEAVQFNFGLDLVYILDFDEKAQIITLKLYEYNTWKDNLINWNPEDYYGLDSVALPADAVWLPDMVLTNSIDKPEKLSNSKLQVRSNGEIQWVPEVIVEANCPVDITDFPHDVQNCTFKYMSWMYNDKQLNIAFQYEEIRLGEFQQSNDWTVVDNPAWKETVFYPNFNLSYTFVHFSLAIERNPAFYNFVIVYPTVLLSFLTPIMFLTPPSCHDRNSYGVGIFGAFFLLLLIVADAIPHALTSIPIFGRYIFANMVLVLFAMFCSTVVCSLHEHDDKKEMPKFLNCLTKSKFRFLLCMEGGSGIDVYDGDKSEKCTKKGEDCMNGWKVLSTLFDRLLFLVFVTTNTVLILLYVVRIN